MRKNERADFERSVGEILREISDDAKVTSIFSTLKQEPETKIHELELMY